MSSKVCKDCRSRQEPCEFPRDKYGRIDTRQCHTCIDQHTPTLLTETEAATRLGISVEQFRSHNLKSSGDYSPPGRATVSLYARSDVDTLKPQSRKGAA